MIQPEKSEGPDGLKNLPGVTSDKTEIKNY